MNVLFSFKQLRTLLAMLAMMIFSFPDAVADAPSLIIKDLGEGHCLVQINTNQRYLLLPVEEVMPDVRVSMIVNNKEVKAADVRLAVNRVDYFVPLDLSGYTGKNVLLKFKLGSNDPVRGKLSAVCCKEMKLADTFDTGNREKFRPTYHFSPLYGSLKGTTAIMFCNTANVPAKLIKDKAKDGIPGLKAAYAEESFYVGADQLDALVAIKSKNEVIADIVALLQSPAKNVISALQSGGNTLHGVLKTLGERPE